MGVAGLWIGLSVLAALLGLVAEAGAGLVEVSWTAPTTNANGSPLTDLAGYRVYMGTSSPACPGSSYHAVAASDPSPAANQTVRATITGLNAGTTYWVRITAVDSRGNQSGCTAAASGVARGTISVSPTSSVSFGSIAVGATLDRTFTVQNTSGASLSGGASVGSPFSIVSGGSFTLAAGASQNVVVRFRPTAIGSFATNVNFTAQGDTISRGLSGSTTGSAPAPPSATPTLSITRGGSGTGTVTGSGISCGTDCSQTYTAGTRVTLTATAASGSTFGGWSGGGCTGTASTCSVTLNASTSVTATFNSATGRTLQVNRSGNGSGTVTSSPSGISCGSDCAQSYTSGTRVTLTATAASGSRFGGWSGGGCSGTGSTCSVTMNAATTVTATFTRTTTTADLAVTAFVMPSIITRNVGFPLSYTVVNLGAAAGSVQLRIYLSRDNRLSSDDVLLYSRTYTSIAAGISLPSAITEVVPSSSGTGTYYVLAIIDATGAVSEQNESNNGVIKAITVR
jgi:CARDB/Divergent InlB B-repeat domain